MSETVNPSNDHADIHITPMANMTFLLPAEHKARMAALAKIQERKPSELYRRAVAAYLDGPDPSNDPR